MPRQFLCPVFGSSLWLALILQSLISSAATYRKPVSGGKRQSFLERTLILLDVNTRSPVKVLNDNFLSLQLDPSIVKDGWLDFLRYYSFRGAKRDTSDPRSRRGIKTLQVLFDRVL
uniref:Uncharacterized protein n=1 Tax=Cyprinus carpio TaxID=7962 RepID=A0A8C1QLT5_CYPCA